MKETKGKYVAFFILGFFLFAGALVLGLLFHNARAYKPYVVVKGLSEREVKADLALWEINFSSGGSDPVVIQTKLDKDREAVVSFLKNQGFEEVEIIPGRVQMHDKLTYSYIPEGNIGERYQVRTSVILRTEKVDLADSVSRMAGELVRLGVVLSENYAGTGPSFLFTKLNDIKGGMLDESLGNARSAADTFAQNTGTVIGGIKSANQGVFSILPRDNTFDARQEQQIYKTVRVVSTIEYYVKN